jgi:structural maintenance of chromosome 3 (chondroitin sulfate proteoglycan 6)
MHIKNIIISQFRSYREQSFSEELSQGHNVIVGRNGSGKSNFFAAVQFVLSEKFANLRPSDRKELVHVGAGRPGFGVFVEIVFDNSDGRFAIPGRPEEAEVRIRRTVGLKQDEFRVNDRKFTAGEVRQLLESAGFSSSNPYYIVEQGKIVNLASMKEEERYQLIKDVAGTKVYEARRIESEQLLEETAAKHETINDAIRQLDDRLKELEAETSELKEFQETDKKRRSYEYCIYNSELQQAKTDLEKMDATWETRVKGANATHEEEQQLEREAGGAEAAAAGLAKRLGQLEQERKTLEKERTALVSRRAIADLQVNEAVGATVRDKQEKAALEKEAQELNKALEQTKQSFAAKSKALATKQLESDKAAAALQAAELRLDVLQAKKGRKRQFTSKADRDAWIKGEITRNDELISANKKELDRLKAEMATIAQSLTSEAQAAVATKNDAQMTEAAIATQEQKRTAAITKRDKLNLERRKLWQQISDQEQAVRRMTEDADRASQTMERATRLDIRQGFQSLEETLNEINDPLLRAAVHGQLISLMKVEPAFLTAVEITAGNALFNVVVDSFDVSARLLDHMNKKKKAGRVTFFPLDTCRATPKDIPTSSEVSLLMNHITFDKKFKGVFAEFFGQTAVVSSLEHGQKIVRDLDCDVVTLDGDQFNRKGGITGGYNDKRKQKVTAYLELTRSNEALAREKLVLEKLCQSVATVEQSITAALEELEQLNSQEAHSRSAADGERERARMLDDRTARLQQQREQLEKSMNALRKQNASVTATSDALKEEAKSDFKVSLSVEEERELETLQNDAAATRAAASTLLAAATQLSMDVQLLESTERHLSGRLQAVRDRVVALGRSPAAVEAQLAKEVATLEEEIKLVDERIAMLDKAVEQVVVDRRKQEEKADALRRKLIDYSRALEEEKDKVDRAHNQRALTLQKKEDALAKIRKLGVIPNDTEKFASFSLGKLMHLLKVTNEELKKFAHVNKKAIDHHTMTSETRQDLAQQRAVLATELQSIHELMDHLDKKKDEAIERTYKQVQFEFENVFKELVSADGCAAELQLVKNPDKKSADPYTAVRIRVSFGVGSAVSELAQLSGGQKSLVALALIFAIQRCDPAPFYLFDEIDAALDAEYRTSVAAMIKRQAEQCQFITATFKTEMLRAADKVLGIFFHNKVSRIQTITMDEGLRLLKQAQQEERQKRGRDDEQ